MRLRSPGLLLLLLSGLRADVQEKEVRAMVGSDVELSCVDSQENTFSLNELFVYWQISVTGKPKTVTYYLSGNGSAGHDDNQYKGRAELSLDGMKRGDFSLRLYNVTPQDEQKFNCLVFRNLERVLNVVVTLHVAANYSMPKVSTPQDQDEELTFTCRSTDGYPRPNVYWINRTDNSLLSKALHNSSVSLNSRGLYDVVSVLRVPRTPNLDVGCCIENVLLHQNLTVSSQAETGTSTGTKSSITESGGTAREGKSNALVAVLVLGLVAVALAVGWACRSQRLPCRRYAGAQAVRPELELTGSCREPVVPPS
ncbi:ICOS ligand isoform X3 [Pteropus medius]|uniref:ICOS ligand isoform X3 n=2 Tax=Pteropus vampyrus TaxID=132908 RepID=UPI00196AA452|nr:ICOS ligand isoform X3 [Pteropus giganteus]